MQYLAVSVVHMMELYEVVVFEKSNRSYVELGKGKFKWIEIRNGLR